MCSFCDQKSISGNAKAPTADEVSALLKQQAEVLENSDTKAQIAFFGGSFTAVPREYMLSLLEAAKQAVERFDAYTGIRCSTRPDCIDEEIIKILTKYGMTAVELGAQSMCDEVLSANDRGHTAGDVRRAANLIKQSGIELGLQMMTGLYCDTPESCLYTAQEFVKLSPKTVRIYPTVILKNTRLGRLFECGEYESFSFEETVSLCAKLLDIFEQNGISVIRMGLHASADVERDMIGGVYHPRFREIVESRRFLEELLNRLKPLDKGDYDVFTDKKNLSRAVGQGRENLAVLQAAGYRIKFRGREGAYMEISPRTSKKGRKNAF